MAVPAAFGPGVIFDNLLLREKSRPKMKKLTGNVVINVSAWTAHVAPRRVCPLPPDRMNGRLSRF